MAIDKVVTTGIVGASGAGKSYLAAKIQSSLPEKSVILSQDFYYKDLSHLTLSQRTKVNFDHPDAIEFEYMLAQLKDLLMGRDIFHPLYDFENHVRKKETRRIPAASLIIIEGTLLYAIEPLRQIINFKIYLDTPMDICLIHRLLRDTRQRGRSIESTVKQYLESVRPMYLQYVQPNRKFADKVIRGGEDLEMRIQPIIRKLMKMRFS